MLRELHGLVRILVVAAGDQREAALGDVDVDLDHAHALLVGHRPELADVADAVVAVELQPGDAMLEIGGVAFLVELVVLGERGGQRGPHAPQHLLRVFLGFVLAVFHDTSAGSCAVWPA
ncbi:hypothetical protein D3C83_43210 [compost metagenome]